MQVCRNMESSNFLDIIVTECVVIEIKGTEKIRESTSNLNYSNMTTTALAWHAFSLDEREPRAKNQTVYRKQRMRALGKYTAYRVHSEGKYILQKFYFVKVRKSCTIMHGKV